MAEDNDVRKYLVVSPLLADGKEYKVGARIDLPAETGEALAAQGVVKPVVSGKPKGKEE